MLQQSKGLPSSAIRVLRSLFNMRPNPTSSYAQFLNDGHQRARAALEPVIRAEVAAEYGQRLSQASFMQRWQLRLAIEREVDRRIECLAPRDAIY